MAEPAEEATSPPPVPEPAPAARPLAEAAPVVHGPGALEILNDVELPVRVDVGRGILTIREILELRRASIIPLDKLSGEPVDIRIGKELLATGEVIVIQDKLRIRVLDVVYPPDQKPEGDQHA